MRMSESTDLPSRCLEALRRAGVPDGCGVVVGMSGGADSTALAELLHGSGYRIEAVHVDYGFRGEESETDARFVRDLALDRGWGFHLIGKPELPGGNRQAAARAVRYAAFERVREQTRCEAVAVAHHADDQLETVLLQIARGSGPDARHGMEPRIGWVVRPLLDIRATELRAWLQARGAGWREDGSNRDLRYRRNRLRQLVVPALGPAHRRAAAAVAAFSRHLAAALDADGARAADAPLVRIPDAALAPSAWSRARTARLLRAFGRRLAPAEWHALLRGGFRPGQRVGALTRERGGWSFRPDGWDLHVRAEPATEVRPGTVTLDADRLGTNYHIRPWQAGDRIRLAPPAGTQKLSDCCNRPSVPAAWKARCRVVVALDGSIAAVIFADPDKAGPEGRVAAAYLPGPDTRHLLRFVPCMSTSQTT